MKKLFIILLVFALSGCSNQGDEVDQTSSATGVWDPSEAGLSEADVQFGNLRKDGQGSSETITTVRPEVTRTIVDQFDSEHVEDRSLENLSYKINDKSFTTAFKNQARHVVTEIGYDYAIEIQRLETFMENEEFIEEFNDRDSELGRVEMSTYGQVLVKNVDGNSYASELITSFNTSSETYAIKFSSQYMSVPEILMLAEEFGLYLK